MRFARNGYFHHIIGIKQGPHKPIYNYGPYFYSKCYLRCSALQYKQLSSVQGTNTHKHVKEADEHILKYFPLARLALIQYEYDEGV